MKKSVGFCAAGLMLITVAAAFWIKPAADSRVADRTPFEATPQLVEHGAYLARAGNCAACHTDRGGAAFAGGNGISTPFGTVYTSNITPDPATGIGSWSASEFWRAMHHGRSADGRLLYPAFPYTEYTHITRQDSDALYAYLMSQTPVQQPNKPHALRFPYSSQAALAVWRTLFFTPGEFQADSGKSAEWNRGAYLVRGLGHCQACHAPRNALGATQDGQELSGGSIPMQNWYAPSLASPQEAGVQNWSTAEIVALLKNGVSPRDAAMGPMAEVVFGSTQHLNERDLQAMAVYLRDLPALPPAPATHGPVDSEALALGQRLYKNQCASCHGESGEGRGEAYPALAGHRTATMSSPSNLVRVILTGGFPPTTAGNPRPYGMPPFGQSMSDAEVAAVASFVRTSWGNSAGPVAPLDVQRVR
ncbi:MAG TPA: c-type cytochrome [Burkholderiales bacterium]